MGNNEKMQSLTLAFGQVRANGRLMGQEVLQMVNAGFNPLQEISRTTGRSMIELKKAMEDGAISASMVEDALKSATSEGGRFYEMNERLKNSAAGQWSKMKSDVELLATEIGTNLMPAAKDLIGILNSGGKKGGQSNVGGLAEFASDGIRAIVAATSDAYTNLDGNSKGTAVGDLADEIQTRDMEKKLLAEYGHVKTQEEKDRIAKNIAARQAKERAELEAAAAREKKALDDKKQAEKEIEDAEKKAAKDKQQEIEKLSKQFEDAHNKRVKEAEELEKATLTPLQEYEKELARISELAMFGAISDDVARLGKDRAGEKLIGQAKAADKSDALGVSQTIAPALKAGSVEAYKFMLNQKDKLYEAAQEQKELTSETLEVAKQQLIATQAIPKLGVKR